MQNVFQVNNQFFCPFILHGKKTSYSIPNSILRTVNFDTFRWAFMLTFV